MTDLLNQFSGLDKSLTQYVNDCVIYGAVIYLMISLILYIRFSKEHLVKIRDRTEKLNRRRCEEKGARIVIREFRRIQIQEAFEYHNIFTDSIFWPAILIKKFFYILKNGQYE